MSKHVEITCTERITLAPDHAHLVLHPHAVEKTYPVYMVDGQRYVEIMGDTRGGKLLTPLSDLIVKDGELRSKHAPRRVYEVPSIWPGDIPALTDITPAE